MWRAQLPSHAVPSTDQNANPIHGYYVKLYDQNYSVPSTRFTTVTFNSRSSGKTYIVKAYGYRDCTLSHWDDDSAHIEGVTLRSAEELNRVTPRTIDNHD